MIRIELLADNIDAIDPLSGGQYGRQLRLCLHMSQKQQRAAVATILGGMIEHEACAWLRSEFPDWFEVAA